MNYHLGDHKSTFAVGKCEELNVTIRDPNLNDGAKRTAAAEFIIHKRRAGKFYKKVKEIQEKCANDETVLGLSINSNELSSFLNHYMDMYVTDTITELHLFCDGCPGQNKNNTVIRFLMALSVQKNKMIHIYFPVRGHSFKTYIDSDISQEIYILLKVKGTCSNLPSQANSGYSGKVPINLKIADISKVKQYTPAKFIDFYEEILQWPKTTERQPVEEEF